MKCVKCGENNKDGASFCSKCGSKLEAKKEDKKEKVEEKNDDVVTVSIDTKEAKNFFAYLKDVFVSPAKTTKKALKESKDDARCFHVIFIRYFDSTCHQLSSEYGILHLRKTIFVLRRNQINCRLCSNW